MKNHLTILLFMLSMVQVSFGKTATLQEALQKKLEP